MSRSPGVAPHDGDPGIQPLEPPRGLTQELVRRLAGDIAAGRLSPGAKLPTEQAMVSTLGVSRTVVREAIAALRADGLVTTRQGVGAFVAEHALARPFRIDAGGLETIAEIIHVMELRLGVEVEAAGLAAERAQATDLTTMAVALDGIDEAVSHGELAIEEDFAFHRGVAAATHNPQFLQFLEFLGRIIIPRQSIRMTEPDPRRYLQTVQVEHRAILDAIGRHAVGDARAAMRRHLLQARDRYRRIAAGQVPRRARG